MQCLDLIFLQINLPPKSGKIVPRNISRVKQIRYKAIMEQRNNGTKLWFKLRKNIIGKNCWINYVKRKSWNQKNLGNSLSQL